MQSTQEQIATTEHGERTDYAMEAAGLDKLVEHLCAAGEDDLACENTGGYNMALISFLLDGTLFAITGEGVDDYLVARYTEAAWNGEDSSDPITLDDHLTRQDVADLLAFRREGTPYPADVQWESPAVRWDAVVTGA